MSASREHYRPSSGHGGGAACLNVSPRRRCEICDGASWCSYVDGFAICRRVAEGGRERVDRAGVPYYVHRREGLDARRWSPMPAAPRRERAPVEVRDRAYRAIVGALTLDATNRTAFLNRKLPTEHIEANLYRTLPERRRAELARIVVEVVGEHHAVAVPGIVRQEDGDRAWLSLGGAPGVIVPVLDLDGRVAALKVRRRDPCDGRRYTYLSSAHAGGASAESACHVPRAALAMRDAPRLVLTEGEIKADIATALLGAPVVSLPGVGAWRAGVDLALAWGAPTIAVALDADIATNPTVARAERSIVDALRRARVHVEVWRWDPRWKGIDDLLVARIAANASTGDAHR